MAGKLIFIIGGRAQFYSHGSLLMNACILVTCQLSCSTLSNSREKESQEEGILLMTYAWESQSITSPYSIHQKRWISLAYIHKDFYQNTYYKLIDFYVF